MDRRTILTTTGATFAIVAVGGCMHSEPGAQEPEGEEFDQPEIEGEVGEIPDHVEVIRHDIAEVGDEVGVVGLIENTGDDPLKFIEVEVALYNGDTLIDRYVDASEQELDVLPQGNQWRFFVDFEGQDVTDATNYTITIDTEVAEGSDSTGNESA